MYSSMNLCTSYASISPLVIMSSIDATSVYIYSSSDAFIYVPRTRSGVEKGGAEKKVNDTRTDTDWRAVGWLKTRI